MLLISSKAKTDCSDELEFITLNISETEVHGKVTDTPTFPKGRTTQLRLSDIKAKTRKNIGKRYQQDKGNHTVSYNERFKRIMFGKHKILDEIALRNIDKNRTKKLIVRLRMSNYCRS
ncbi:hypothetical protein NPIL_360891 [Nephila pilipes]|uniref:Uncharacterized protein n=1 Tax=Nephila pilipes TaxID=299642 RepID=A0A8X6TSP8_NEPPI|nr:hypothetical protein NPIL_360891 [Nephila pilipes]